MNAAFDARQADEDDERVKQCEDRTKGQDQNGHGDRGVVGGSIGALVYPGHERCEQLAVCVRPGAAFAHSFLQAGGKLSPKQRLPIGQHEDWPRDAHDECAMTCSGEE